MYVPKEVLRDVDAAHLLHEQGRFFCPSCDSLQDFVAQERDGRWFVGCAVCQSEPAICGQWLGNGHFCRNYAAYRTKIDKEYFCDLHCPNLEDLDDDDEIEFLEGV